MCRGNLFTMTGDLSDARDGLWWEATHGNTEITDGSIIEIFIPERGTFSAARSLSFLEKQQQLV